MKTPEEIKKGLEYCMSGNAPCERCPFVTRTGSKCIQHMSEDALAYIQQLEAAQLPRWISIGEKMPEVSDIALVIANGKPRPNVTLHNAILIASYWGEEGWIADGFEDWDALQVTHWMPLPEPPKEGT